MTVSGTTNFSMTVEELVTYARGMLGIQDEEEPLTAVDLKRGITTLNMMLHSWQADGVQTWVLTEGQLTLVEGDYAYAFGAGGDFAPVPAEITDIRVSRGNSDLQMLRLSREEYYSLPNRTNKGYPTQFYYDRQRDGGTLYVWPAPDVTPSVLHFTYRRRIMDVGEGANTPDLPIEWMEAIASNLAVRLSPHYGGIDPARLQEVMNIATSSYAVLKAFDTAEGMGIVNIWPDLWQR